ncbi:MAG: FkbM family methyltransferase [Proteobacteria bacterium]|nr:FkbM family methyltransferase [Pseudomonadota bacterium]
MPVYRLNANAPLTLECPERMRPPLEYVLSGEYESHHDGTGLDILDVGGNVGAFALWAVRRWPDSRVHSFEPNPDTYEFFKRNTAGYAGIRGTNAALFPGGQKRAKFFAQYAGDGEAGLEAYARDTFTQETEGTTFEVDVVDPATLPSADIVKIDIEGGEAIGARAPRFEPHLARADRVPEPQEQAGDAGDTQERRLRGARRRGSALGSDPRLRLLSPRAQGRHLRPHVLRAPRPNAAQAQSAAEGEIASLAIMR